MLAIFEIPHMCLFLSRQTAIAVTLGMPALPDEWSNEKVLAFVRLMWRNWGKKRGPSENGEEEEAKGPAPPAAVATAAKIALASLGNNPGAELYVEPRKGDSYNDDAIMNTQSPLMPQHAALIERTFSGRLQLPSISDEKGTQDGFLEAWTESSAFCKSSTAVSYQVSGLGEGQFQAPLDNPEQRNRNLRWLRTHFRPLVDVGKVPFNNADLWQLHQYYFSPPYFGEDGDNESNPSSSAEDNKSNTADPSAVDGAPKGMTVASSTSVAQTGTGIGKTPSFHALNTALQAAALASTSHKRRGHIEDIDGSTSDNVSKEDTSHSAKRSKCLKPRIAYYPRIRVS